MAGTKEHACGDCTMCCKIMGVNDPALKKPPNQWCTHCQIGKGCGIYESRPVDCRKFECLWLQTPDMPDGLRPDKSKVVFWVTTDGKTVIAGVDPARPDAYKEGMAGRLVDVMIERGGKLIVVNGDRRKVLCGSVKDAQEVYGMIEQEGGKLEAVNVIGIEK